jgi:uncharacterized protein with von Willebrand factor type A (vWA) domain
MESFPSIQSKRRAWGALQAYFSGTLEARQLCSEMQLLIWEGWDFIPTRFPELADELDRFPPSRSEVMSRPDALQMALRDQRAVESQVRDCAIDLRMALSAAAALRPSEFELDLGATVRAAPSAGNQWCGMVGVVVARRRVESNCSVFIVNVGPGTVVYTVEFSDGTSADFPESFVERA